MLSLYRWRRTPILFIAAICCIRFSFGCKELDRKGIVTKFDKKDFFELNSATQEEIDTLANMTAEQGAEAWSCNKPVRMQNNDKVTHLRLPKSVHGVQIEGNRRLEIMDYPGSRAQANFSIELDGHKIDELTYSIFGNNRLRNLHEFLFICGQWKSHCDKENTCSFYKFANGAWKTRAIDDLSELNRCKYVNNHLLMDAPVYGYTTAQVEEVAGLSIKNTNLTSLVFLHHLKRIRNQYGQNEITGNADLCISVAEMRHLIDLGVEVSPERSINEHMGKCNLYCTQDDFNSTEMINSTEYCNSGFGHFTVRCPDRIPKMRVLMGTLEMIKCSSNQAIEQFRRAGNVTNYLPLKKKENPSMMLIDPKDNLKKFHQYFSHIDAETIKSRVFQIRITRPLTYKENADEQMKFYPNKVLTNYTGPPTGECTFHNNIYISSIHTSQCNNSIYGDLIITNNTQSVVDITKINGCLVIRNPRSSFNFDFLLTLEDVKKQCKWPQLHGERETKLVNNNNECIPYRIRSNITKNIKRMLPGLDDVGNYKFCSPRDCVFHTNNQDVDTNCPRVDGDLVLDQNTKSVSPFVNISIHGCFSLTNTTKLDYSFLYNIKHYEQKCIFTNGTTIIANNSCIPRSIRKSLNHPQFTPWITDHKYNNFAGCECVFYPTVKGGVRNCKLIDGDLILNEKSTAVDPMVETVEGCIRIVNTTIQDFKFLRNLTSYERNCIWTDEVSEVRNNSCIPREIRKVIMDKTFFEMANDVKYANFYKCKCVFHPTAVAVDSCLLVDGDLLLDDNSKEVKGVTKTIDGCFRMINTTLKDYKFLLTLEEFKTSCVWSDDVTDMRGNPCIPLEIRKQLNGTLFEMAWDIERRNYLKCQCTFFPVAKTISGCAWVDGDLILDVDSKQVDAGFTEVAGCIRMHHTHLKDYSFLTKIKTYAENCTWNEMKTEIQNNPCVPLDIRQILPPGGIRDMVLNITNKNFLECKCVFFPPKTVIEGCDTIDGDLLVDENTKRIEPHIRKVTGCIRIRDTRLPSYEFLKKIESFSHKCQWIDRESEFENNDCIPFKIRNATIKPLSKLLNNGKNNLDCQECDGGKVQDMDTDCRLVMGDLIVEGVTNLTLTMVEQRLKTMENVYGRVIVQYNEVDVITFHNLRFITSDKKGVPLEIRNNSELVTLEMPRLEAISGNSGGSLVVIEENPSWKPSNSFKKTTKRVAGECTNKKNSPCYFAQFVVEKKAETQTTEEPKTEDEGNGMAIGIGVTVALVAVLVIVVVAVVAVVLVRRKKMSSKGGKKKDKGGKGAKEAKGKPAAKGAKKASQPTTTPTTGTQLTKSPSQEQLLPKATGTPSKTPSKAATPSKAVTAKSKATVSKSKSNTSVERMSRGAKTAPSMGKTMKATAESKTKSKATTPKTTSKSRSGEAL